MLYLLGSLTADQERRLWGKRAQVIMTIVNSLRPGFANYTKQQRKFALDSVAAIIYYLPPISVNKKVKGYSMHHLHRRHKAAQELLTAPQDVTVDEVVRNYKEFYGRVKWIPVVRNNCVHCLNSSM